MIRFWPIVLLFVACEQVDKTRLADVVCRSQGMAVYNQVVISDVDGRIDWAGTWHRFVEYPTMRKTVIHGDCDVRYKALPETRDRYNEQS